MRLSQILYGGLGGHASVVFSLIDGDGGKAFQHSVIFFGVEPVREAYLQRCAERAIDFRIVELSRRSPLATMRAFRTALNELSPDVTICHSAAQILPTLLFARRRGVPVILVEHQANVAKSWRHRMWSRVGLRGADAVVLLTEEYLAEYVRMHPRAAVSRLRVIGNGIDTERFRPGDPVGAPRLFNLGMASRLTALRDHVGLIRALKALARYDWRLLLAGEGPQANGILREIQLLNLDHHVQLLGPLDEQGVVTFLQRLHIYVHTSFAETMSTAIMQAMATGLPVVAYDIPGVRGMVEDGVTGLLVPPGDGAALRDAIQFLMEEPSRRAALGSAARRHARAHWTQEEMFARYASLIRECFGRDRQEEPVND